MPDLDISELNVLLSVIGGFVILTGFISTQLKQRWFIGEALPALAVGICLGPIAAELVENQQWGSGEDGEGAAISLAVVRIVIGIQLVMAGYQLPARYTFSRWKELLICMIPIMMIMWFCTTGCLLATISGLDFLTGLAVASCVTCTDPVLSQAIAKGPFADKYVRRPLREIISAEAGANDGFAFLFLTLSAYLLDYVAGKDVGNEESVRFEGDTVAPVRRDDSGDTQEVFSGVGVALEHWFTESWCYMILLSIVYGALVGLSCAKGLKMAQRRKWVDNESYLLYPTAIGLFCLGTCGTVGTDDLLACFVAGSALNWDGKFLEQTQRRHDEVSNCIDVLLNAVAFMYIGAAMPWSEFHNPEGSGITIGRLFGLGFAVLFLRRIPAVLSMYRLMPAVVQDYKDALFMGYFGPIGVGAIFDVEHARSLFPPPKPGDVDEFNLRRDMRVIVYWLVLFSVIVHGLSIPALSVVYRYLHVKPIKDDAVEVHKVSSNEATPANAVLGDADHFIAYNRFSRPNLMNSVLTLSTSNARFGGLPGSNTRMLDFESISGIRPGSRSSDDLDPPEINKRRRSTISIGSNGSSNPISRRRYGVSFATAAGQDLGNGQPRARVRTSVFDTDEPNWVPLQRLN